ncbi:MAG: T9SS type A sorting domain-containing protein [Bacteroidales bacterium]
MGIDYANETTSAAVGANIQYSENASLVPATAGTGAPVALTPGSDLYFRFGASAASLASQAMAQDGPARPVLSSTESGTTDLTPFVLKIDFAQTATGIQATDFTVVNATLGAVSLVTSSGTSTSYETLVYGTDDGEVSISLPAGSINEGNFRSDAFTILFEADHTGIGTDPDAVKISVYPNPSSGQVHIEGSRMGTSPVLIRLYSPAGALLLTEEMEGSNKAVLDVQHLEDGLYIVKVSGEGFQKVSRIMLQK